MGGWRVRWAGQGSRGEYIPVVNLECSMCTCRTVCLKQGMRSWMLTQCLCHYLCAGLDELLVCQNVTETCFPNHSCLYLHQNLHSHMERRHMSLSLLPLPHPTICRSHLHLHRPSGYSRVRPTPMACFICTTTTPSLSMIQRILLALLIV